MLTISGGITLYRSLGAVSVSDVYIYISFSKVLVLGDSSTCTFSALALEVGHSVETSPNLQLSNQN